MMNNEDVGNVDQLTDCAKKMKPNFFLWQIEKLRFEPMPTPYGSLAVFWNEWFIDDVMTIGYSYLKFPKFLEAAGDLL